MMVVKMKCYRCHNEDKNKMYMFNNQYYCRDCITFGKVLIDKNRETKLIQYNKKKVSYHLDFELSKKQKLISTNLKNNYVNGKNSIVLAVCGSGKTEIVFEVICHALNQGERVCFCVPRKEIVKELYERIKSSFANIDIGLCIGGFKENEDAQMIVCTMHQLYRFENYTGFHLMIADEVDAFPFYKNKVLNEIFKRCTLKNYIKLSATVFKEDIGDEQVLIMNRRYHGDDLPVPKLYIIMSSYQRYLVLYLIKKEKKKFLLFVESKAAALSINEFLVKHNIRCDYVFSSRINNREVIEKLVHNEIDVLITTTLLERGVTLKDIHVIVYHCEDYVFNERTLIQIAGRVGRKIGYTKGNVYFISNKKTQAICKCIKTIKELNSISV